MGKKLKRSPIRTLAEAERWCVEQCAELKFWPYQYKSMRWQAAIPSNEAFASTAWAAVEKLRKKVEGR